MDDEPVDSGLSSEDDEANITTFQLEDMVWDMEKERQEKAKEAAPAEEEDEFF
ncbi:MAG: hypothetical protein QF415_05245 [Candidatus Undinarchaeales archaeon]|jgi:hypothetical protein|nr:hypothetical protein [Candidatus Undinarchaeales archaeon]MDP7494175.1 hypothetical protein [Candidatus Undinarchaeales archaeon]